MVRVLFRIAVIYYDIVDDPAESGEACKGFSLEKLLSDNMVEADFFITIPEKFLRHMLRDLLGETPELHDSIIHSVMQVSKIPTGLTC